MYKLIIEDDEGKTTVVPLIRDEISIGRKEGNTIRLTERNVSRRHARIVRQNGGAVYLEDLQSHNGIKVNGEKIDGKAAIGEGDRIQIGDYQLSLKLDRTETKAPPAGVAAADNQQTSQFVKPEAQLSAMTVPTMAMPAAVMPTQAQAPAPAPTPVVATSQPGTTPERPARLIVISQNFFAQEFPIDKAAVVIGRTDENDVVINHRSISRHHAKVVREGGHFHIVDLQSANGVRVNGEEYGKVELRKGDKIDLGHVRLVFVPPGQDYEMKGKGEVTEKEDRRGGLFLALGAVVLLVGIGVTVKVVMPRLGGGGGKADPDVEAVTALADIDGDLLAKRWSDASQKADGLLRRADVSASRREVATTKKERAEQEKRNQDIYERFSKAGGSGNYDDALKVYRDLAADSVYRQVAKEEYDKLFPLFVSNHLQKADVARRSGDCTTAQAEVDKVLAAEPKHLQALTAKDQPCGTKVAVNDRVEKPERPERPDRPTPDRTPKTPKTPKPTGEGKTRPEPDEGKGSEAGSDASEVEAAKLNDAMTALTNGDTARAIELARPLGKFTRAWRIIGAAACQLKDTRQVTEAYRHLDASGKQYLQYVCLRYGVLREGSSFRLGD